MKELCVFYQAPAELPYVIQLYDEYKGKALITIIVVNVFSNFEFLKTLNLSEATIIFCDWPCRNKKLIHSLSESRKLIRKFWNKNLASISNGEVFFFSSSFDWVTAFFMKKFCTNENIKVIYAGFNTTELTLKDGYENGTMNKGLSLRDYIRLLILLLITGIWFDYYKKLSCISFPYYRYGIKYEPIKLKVEVLIPYKYEIPCKNDKIVMLFTTTWDYEGNEVMDLVDKKVCNIVKMIQNQDFKVVAKGHPRLGLARIIEQTVDVVLPNYIPAEFISEKNVKMVVGLNSAAIIYFAIHSDIKVISLLKMIEGINDNLLKDNITLLTKMCGDKIEFPRSSEEFMGLL